jgi:hypothetical protein
VQANHKVGIAVRWLCPALPIGMALEMLGPKTAARTTRQIFSGDLVLFDLLKICFNILRGRKMQA